MHYRISVFFGPIGQLLGTNIMQVICRLTCIKWSLCQSPCRARNKMQVLSGQLLGWLDILSGCSHKEEVILSNFSTLSLKSSMHYRISVFFGPIGQLLGTNIMQVICRLTCIKWSLCQSPCRARNKMQVLSSQLLGWPDILSGCSLT